jgi:hypothetical protein
VHVAGPGATGSANARRIGDDLVLFEAGGGWACRSPQVLP